MDNEYWDVEEVEQEEIIRERWARAMARTEQAILEAFREVGRRSHERYPRGQGAADGRCAPNPPSTCEDLAASRSQRGGRLLRLLSHSTANQYLPRTLVRPDRRIGLRTKR